jgi:hypothetical protein
MSDWEYYETNGTVKWVINNKKTHQFFYSEYKSEAQWLTDLLNEKENSRFDDGIALTDDGDLVKVTCQGISSRNTISQPSYKDIKHPYTGE